MIRTAILTLIILLGLGALALAGNRPPSQQMVMTASPAATPVADRLPRAFLPLLLDASAQADRLVALGESRERNLFHIRAEQGAMLSALSAADAWLAAHPALQDDVAIAAYRAGADTIRSAMTEAQAGFLRLDFERVARAHDTLQAGALSLHQAIDILATS